MRPSIFALVVLAFSGVSAPSLAQEKYALSMFHFNVQYVCGGTIGYTPNPNPLLDFDNDTIEDLIVTESLEPVIDLYAKHPTWGADIEMQAYMLDIIAWRHPALLDKIRVLAKAGQIDVVSFHYSDQLFIAYPAEDWERSQKLTAERFAEHDVPLSRTVFCQEGQGAAAMARALPAHGYRNMVWPKNLWSYQHGDTPAMPLYQFGDAFMVQGGRGVSFDDGNGLTIDVKWTFFDDGELLATGDINPYFPEIFRVKQEAVDEYEDKLLDLESQGYQIVTVDKYVDAVLPVVTPAVAPPLLDGTWQPDSTGGVARWLGGRGLFWQQERDNHVRVVGAQAHRELVAAEVLVDAAGLGNERALLDAAWRMLFLGQVTDASGINPFRGEIQYGISHMTEAMSLARRVTRAAKAALGASSLVIDPANGSVAEGSSVEGWAEPFAGTRVEAPMTLTIDAGDRANTQSWELIEDGHHRVTIDFGAGEYSNIAVTFEGELEDSFAVGLALDDETVFTLQRNEFMFEEFHFALPTGYIGIGGGRFVIKDMGHVHVAAAVQRESAGVVFRDDTVAPEERARWVFHVIDGTAEQAAQRAIDINVARRLVR